MVHNQNHIPRGLKAAAIGSLFILGACANQQSAQQGPEAKETIEPERAVAAASRDETQTAKGERFMVVTANPHASRAAYAILDLGGSALDAALAAQMVLGLTEPQSSGIGGGAFLLHWDGKKKKLTSYDGRETAPSALDNSLFFNQDGSKKGFMEAVVGGSSIGVPGLIKMFELAHKNHGKLPVDTLLSPATTLAEQGFPISPRLHGLLSRDKFLKLSPTAAPYFYDQDLNALPVGHILKNPDYARTLRLLSNQGLSAFYSSTISKSIVKASQINGGKMTDRDMAGYEAKIRPNLCNAISSYQLCGMGPPSSGGLAVGQIMGLLDHTGIGQFPPTENGWDPKGVHIFSEAMKLAHADRDFYVGDSDFVSVPDTELLSYDYLKRRSADMDFSNVEKKRAQPGFPDGIVVADQAPHQDQSLPSTTHLVIVDQDGNAVSMTSSIENAFGSRIMASGFLLNNQLTDFSSHSEKNGHLVANRAQPLKRPRSSMAPTMLFKEGELAMAIGSPGGSRIIGYVAKSLTAHIHWGIPLEDAIARPHFMNRNNGLELEDKALNQALNQAMQTHGYSPKMKTMTSGIHAITVSTSGELKGFADPRREGLALGK